MLRRILLLSMVLIVMAGAGRVLPDRYTLRPGSRITVEGTSTLHDWHCKAEQFTGTFTTAGGGKSIEALTGVDVAVPVKSLGCGNKQMDGKMFDALKSKEHPQVRYVLTKAQVTGGPQQYQIAATGKLTIAGAERPVSMTVQGQQLADGRIQFKGSLPISLKEFGMKAPSAALGTIRTGDKVTIRFDVTAGPAGGATAQN